MILSTKLKAMITRLRIRVARLEDIFNMLQKTAYGDLAVSARDPEIQISAQYDTSTLIREVTVSSGTAGVTGGEFFASSGTSSDGLAAIFSDNVIIAKPGQGVEIIIGARFDPAAADSRQTTGASTASDSILFGYLGTQFGTFFVHDGRVQVEELTITTPAAGAESTTITINGTGFTVPITSGTVQHNASQIAASLNTQVPLYNFTQNDDQVVARSIFAAPETGSFAFSSPGAAVAAWVQITDGVTSTEDFTAQADWSEGAGAVPEGLDPEMINTYKIVHNGDVSYYILDGETGSFTLVHRSIHTNTEQTPMFSTASFRLVWASTNTGATTDMVVRGTFASAFNQGRRVQTIGTESAFNTALAVSTTPTNILTIRCREVFGTKVNLGRILPVGVSAATDGNKGAIIQVVKNAVFTGEMDFEYQDKDGSIAEIDKTALPLVSGEVLASLVILTSVSLGVALFRNILLPGDVVSIVMSVPSGAAADMNASAIWEEDL